MSVPKKRGRTVYTEAIAAEICERLAAGESLFSICRDAHMPAENRVREWALEDRADKSGTGAGFAARYARARSMGYERLAEEAIRIADEPCLFNGVPDNALVQKQKLQVDARKWFLSKLLPKQFGDKITQELVGSSNQPLLTRIELVAVPPRHPGALIEDGGDEAPPRARLLPRSGSGE